MEDDRITSFDVIQMQVGKIQGGYSRNCYAESGRLDEIREQHRESGPLIKTGQLVGLDTSADSHEPKANAERRRHPENKNSRHPASVNSVNKGFDGRQDRPKADELSRVGVGGNGYDHIDDQEGQAGTKNPNQESGADARDADVANSRSDHQCFHYLDDRNACHWVRRFNRCVTGSSGGGHPWPAARFLRRADVQTVDLAFEHLVRIQRPFDD